MALLAQRNFSGGEISPSLYSRTDISKYQNGLRTCRNMLVMRHSGITNRPGSKFIGEVADSTYSVRLIPFIFNSDQTYCLEFGNLTMRVIRNAGYVTETAKTISSINQADPCVITTSAAHGYSDGDEVFVSAILGMTELNGRNFKVVTKTLTSFSIQYLDGTDVDSTGFTAYSSSGQCARIYTLTTPYSYSDLGELNFVQSADVVTLTHPSYEIRELTRTDHTSWSIDLKNLAPEIAAPGGLAVSGSSGASYYWVVTSVDAETFEESLPTSPVGANSAPTSGSPRTLSWSSVSGAGEYNVYANVNGIYGFIGTAGSNSFVDDGITPDTTDTPPSARNPFNATDDYPSVCAYLQQRLVFANTNNEPEKIWGSRIGLFDNFTTSTPLQDDDAITFNLVGRQVNAVKHILDLGKPVLMTSAGEWVCGGNDAGILTPGQINPKQQSYSGSGDLRPLVIGSTAIFLQARNQIVRDLAYNFETDGYIGNDLTIFSSHLFKGYTLVDWDFQQVPHSILWAVRSDGSLLSMTYVREQQLLGWARHDFGEATVENICIVPEGVEDAIYLAIKRTVDGRVVRYVERLSNREYNNLVDAIFMDSTLSYDGRNYDDTLSMTLSGGSSWDQTETLTLTASSSYFASTDTNKEIHLTGSDGSLIRFDIRTYSSGTVVTGKADKLVPAGMRSVAITDWSLAISEVTNLWHLEGKEVSVFADSFVIASPNNSTVSTSLTVTDGMITLPYAHAVIHVGLPYISDIQTLDIDLPNQQSMADKTKKIHKIYISMEASRGLWAGTEPPSDDSVDPLENLFELKTRFTEGYDEPVNLTTGIEDVEVNTGFNQNGRIFLRNVDPLPLTILGVFPKTNLGAPQNG